MTVKFQLAIQGGGARVFDLLTALEVIQEYEREGKIEITRLAGTSAGALGAAAYACAPDGVERIQAYLSTNGEGLVREITGGRNPTLGVRAGWKLWRGQALLSMPKFREVVHRLIGHAMRSITKQPKFGDLWKKQLFIYASDVVARGAHIYQGHNTVLVEAVLDSAALPLAFRSVTDLGSNTRVDGGLCENLPSDVLSADTSFGQVLAISFPNHIDGALPADVFSYLGAILSTAINHSVNRSKAALGAQAVLSIDSDIDTFSFAQAIGPNRKKEAELIKIKTKVWLDENIARARNPTTKKFDQGKRLKEVMENAAAWYAARHFAVPRRCVKTSLVITANSLIPGEIAVKDVIDKNYFFAPENVALDCFYVMMATSEDDSDTGEFEVLDPEGNRLDFRLLPALEADGTIGGLVLFDRPLPPMSDEEFKTRGPYRLRYRYATKAAGIAALAIKGHDYIRLKNERADTYRQVDVVIYIPQSFSIRYTAELRRGNEVVSVGQLTEREAMRYQDGCPVGRKTLAWRANDLPVGSEFRIDLFEVKG